jgi:hypothetical protein
MTQTPPTPTLNIEDDGPERPGRHAARSPLQGPRFPAAGTVDA